jgi:hypothetical protein
MRERLEKVIVAGFEYQVCVQIVYGKKVVKGYFYKFDDYESLRTRGYYRLIPENSYLAFLLSLQRSNEAQKDLSVVLEAKNIRKIEMVRCALSAYIH